MKANESVGVPAGADPNEYEVQVDPLHRNVWPVTWHGEVIGRVTEHITVNLDGVEPPIVRWSWTLNVSEGDEPATASSKPRFTSHADALRSLARVHRATLADEGE